MGNLLTRLSQLALGDMDSALDPEAYRPKLETEFNTPESKALTRVQLPDPRSISRGIDRTPLFGLMKQEGAVDLGSSTPFRSFSEEREDEKVEESEVVSIVPKRLLETDLDGEFASEQMAPADDFEAPEVLEEESVETDIPSDSVEAESLPVATNNENTPSEVSVPEKSVEVVAEVTNESFPDEALEKHDSLFVQATSKSDLQSLRKNLFTTPQQSVKTKRVPLGFVCPNTNFDSLQENPLNMDDGKNWKNVTDERYRRGLTASSDPENTPPSVLRLTEPPEGVQSAPGKFRNASRKRFEVKNSPGLFI